MIKEVTLRKGKGASGSEIELDIPSKEKLEELLYQDYRLEDAYECETCTLFDYLISSGSGFGRSTGYYSPN